MSSILPFVVTTSSQMKVYNFDIWETLKNIKKMLFNQNWYYEKECIPLDIQKVFNETTSFLYSKQGKDKNAEVKHKNK